MTAQDLYSGKDIAGIESIVQTAEQQDERWRQEAEERIRQHRMAEVQITVVDDRGEPVPKAEVRVRLTRHAFRFGGIVSAKKMSGAADSTVSAEEYRNIFLQFGFNAAGFGNALKYKLRRSHEALAPELLGWFEEHDIPVRGHCLIWPGRDHMSREMTRLVEECKDDPTRRNKEKLRQMCKEQIETWAPRWNVFEWDVINEPRGNFQVADLLGEEVYAEWFKLARKYAVNPDAGLYLNENRVISDPAPGIRTKRIELYAPLTALGLQSRFHSMLDAEVIYGRLCLVDKLGLPIAATEFEINKTIEGELNKAVMTERVMTVYFSHPSVNGIYAWTLLPNTGEKQEGRNILNEKGRPNLRGKVWLYLMKNRWMTDETLTTDSNGKTSLHGFLGDYEITIEHNGRIQTVPLTLDKSLHETIRL